MEKGKNGVVYFSFGSSVKTNNIPKEFKQNLLEAFKMMSDYHFLVKIDKGDEVCFFKIYPYGGRGTHMECIPPHKIFSCR
jgi:hypothetical protein